MILCEIEYEAERPGKGRVRGVRYVLGLSLVDVKREAEQVVRSFLLRSGPIEDLKILGIEQRGSGIHPLTRD